MFLILQFIVFAILIPIIYCFILMFDILLLMKSRTLVARWRSLAGMVAGFLISVTIILLDQFYGPLFNFSEQPNNINSVWPLSVIFTIIGFVILLIIDFLLGRGFAPFVILVTTVVVFVSSYYLITRSENRIAITMSTLGFVIGQIIYFMMFPSRIYQALRGNNE